MTEDLSGFDPALFGAWPAEPVYGTGPEVEAAGPGDVTDEARLRRRLARVLLEIKSAEGAPAEALRGMLNDMTAEMRRQFDFFVALREAADGLPEDAEEAAQKLARADVKAATDAMSLIVRTLEKIDALQRQLARDRDAAAERQDDILGREQARAHFLALIEARAEERALLLFSAWKGQGVAAAAADGGRCAPEPPG